MTTRKFDLTNGATLEFIDLEWTKTGRLFAQVRGYSPDRALLADSKIELSDSASRNRVAMELAAHNGAQPDVWRDFLLDAWSQLSNERAAAKEPFAPVDLSLLDDPPAPKEVWAGLITEKTNTSLYGDSGQGKSTLVDGLAISIATGKPFLGRVVQQGPVVILDWELTRDITLHRLFRIARGFGMDRPPQLFYQTMFDPLTSHLPDIIAWCENINPVLLVVDSMGPACGGDPMNHERAILLMNALRKLPTSPLVVDHQANPISGQNYGAKREFGTSYKRHLTRSSLQVEMASNSPGKASIILRQQKDNFGPKSDPIPFHLRFDGDAIRFEMAGLNDAEFQDVETLSKDRLIEDYLNQTLRATKEEIMEGCNIDPGQTFDNAMTKLKRRRTDLKIEGSGSQKRIYSF